MAFSEPGSSPRAAGRCGNTRRAACFAALLLAAGPSNAFFNDRLELWFSEAATWDSNVFRLPGDASPARGFSDRILTHSAGVTLDLPVSLQRFRASYTRFWTRYDKFDHLDFDGDLVSASWLWAVTREFTGEVGYDESMGLASFAAFGGTEQDIIRTRNAYANGNWLLTPRWLAYAGLSATERKHDRPERRVQDIEARSAELRMSYISPKENRVGVSARFEDGGSPQTRLVGGVPFDNAYRQLGVGVVGQWDITERSRLDGRVDYVKREYDQFSERDYSGPAWGVTYTWTPTPKFSLASTVRRDIAPLDDVQTSFVLSTGVSTKPRWQLTEKVAVIGSLDYARWKYQGDPLIGGDFEQTIRAGLVGFAWTPFRRVVVTGSLQREVRTSDLRGGDYRVTVGTLDARIGF